MRFTQLDDWLRWQERLHPRTIELGLDRVMAVWQRLSPGGLGLPVVTVGGTNGKGSCVAVLDAIYRAAGYRPGCYTSPHLLRYNERILIGGEQIGDEALCAACQQVDEARGEVPLTYFEFGTLVALQLFAAARPDVVILEVGLGGRLDAVNLIDADVALVSSVAIDHTAWLGETLGKIAPEKAGIFRAGRPAIIAQPAPPAELPEEAERIGAHVYLAGHEFRWEPAPGGWRWYGLARCRDALPPPRLQGRHQYDNAAAVLMALDCLEDRLPVSQAAVRVGLQRVRLAGRFQVVPGPVKLVLDVAHNEAAAQVLAQNLAALHCSGTLHAVFGILGDKDAAGMARVLAPQVTRWYLAAPRDARAVAAVDLQRRLAQAGVDGPCTCYAGVSDALAAARHTALAGDCILVFGSFVTVGEAMQRLDL